MAIWKLRTGQLSQRCAGRHLPLITSDFIYVCAFSWLFGDRCFEIENATFGSLAVGLISRSTQIYNILTPSILLGVRALTRNFAWFLSKIEDAKFVIQAWQAWTWFAYWDQLSVAFPLYLMRAGTRDFTWFFNEVEYTLWIITLARRQRLTLLNNCAVSAILRLMCACSWS